MPFYTFLSNEIDLETKSFWKLLGNIIEMPDTSVNTISRATIGVFNQIIGATKKTKFKYARQFKLLQYMDHEKLELSRNYEKLNTLNEMESKGLIPGDYDYDRLDFNKLATLRFLAHNLKNLPMKLLWDDDFCDTVFHEFDIIMTEENIDCFSYNSVFSTMWRYLCRFQDDARLIALRGKLVRLVHKLSDTNPNKRIMNEWLLESEKQLKLEIEKTEKEIKKAKHIGKTVKKVVEKAVRNSPDVMNMIEINELESETMNAKNALRGMKEKKYENINVEWKKKRLKKWTHDDVLGWVHYIGVPNKWRRIMVNGVKNNRVKGKDLALLESGQDIGDAFDISDAPKLCEAIYVLIQKLKSNQKKEKINNENRFTVNIFSQGKPFKLKKKVTKNDRVIYVKKLYKKQSKVAAPICDINFYSRSKLLQENKTLQQVEITDERHLISVRFGAGAGGENKEDPRCICSKILTKTKITPLTNVCCDYCHDRIDNADDEYYHCTNTKTTVHSARNGYDVCTRCAFNPYDNEIEEEEIQSKQMIVTAEKRILRLQELGMIIESHLENDIKPQIANIESKMSELTAITDEGAYGEVESVRNDCKKGLHVLHDYADKTVDLGKKVKKCEVVTNEFVVEMKKAQVYLSTKKAVFKSLDVIRNDTEQLQNDQDIIINNETVRYEIKEIENEQTDLINEIESIHIDENECKNNVKYITETDEKVNVIIGKVETHMNRLKEINDKIENNLQNDIQPKAQEIRNQTQEISELEEKKSVPIKEVQQWKTEFDKQKKIVKDFIKKNNNLQSKIKTCYQKFANYYGKIKKKQKNVSKQKELYIKRKKSPFSENITNHRGQILAMAAAPNKYEMATSAKDKTVKLWKINLSQNQKLSPFFSTKISGVALSLSYNKIGNYLAAGCAYESGAQGKIIVWGCDSNATDTYSTQCEFTSSSQLRFSRVHCIEWSNDSKYIFSGDTTGVIWIWDFVNKTQLAQINAHKDVVHDICVSPQHDALFSCSLDYTICVFNLKQLNKKKKKKSSKRNVNINKIKGSKTMLRINKRPSMDSSGDEANIKKNTRHKKQNSNYSSYAMRRQAQAQNKHKKTKSLYDVTIPKHSKSKSKSVHEQKINNIDEEKYNEFYENKNEYKNVYEAKILIKSEKYAFNNIVTNKDGSHIIAGSRKLHCWKWNGFKSNLDKGPIIADNDYEYIECVQIQNELMCVTRKGKNKVKIFNTKNGKKILEKKFKGPIGKVDFLFDNQYCVVCVQKTTGDDKNNKKLTYKRPAMYVWNYAS